MRYLAIDPGPVESAIVLIDSNRKPVEFGKFNNEELIPELQDGPWCKADRAVVEMVASYGMAVGAEVFETCVWIGRFYQMLDWFVVPAYTTATLVKRQEIKLHHCHDSRAKDSNITQALVDRFAPGRPNRGKGTKADPGWFYGFKADIWQAYALAVYAADKGL